MGEKQPHGWCKPAPKCYDGYGDETSVVDLDLAEIRWKV